MRSLIFILFIGGLVSCSPTARIINKFNDSQVVRIADLTDRRNTDSLSRFLNHVNPVYRYESSQGFSSVQDTTVIATLGKLLLDDTSRQVRLAATRALGQTPTTTTQDYLVAHDRKPLTSDALEALGKSATTLAPIQEATHTSWLRNPAGVAWMQYRYASRFPLDTIAGFFGNNLDSIKDFETRYATSWLAARGVKSLANVKSHVMDAALLDKSPEIRMNAAFALRRIKDSDSFLTLKKIIQYDRDYRVRVNALRSLQAFPPEEILPILIGAVQDKDINVSITASEVMIAILTLQGSDQLKSIPLENLNWRVRTNILAALLKTNPTSDDVALVKAQLSTKNLYEKAALILALQHSVDHRQFIAEFIQDPAPVIRSSAATALVSMMRIARGDELRAILANDFKSGISSGDMAIVGILSEAIADTALHFRTLITNPDFLEQARAKLTLPRDIEAIVPLERAIAFLKGVDEPKAPVNAFNHPINWALVKQIRSDQKVAIETTKGTIVIQLFVESTPGTVANFISLAQKGYFNGKYFHRVVPNFVVQAGCNRGDGWGSEDYSIRSEFTGPKFVTGSVGMASAGKDTEGTQWFITHSPTPHLDGRYTNFAQVVSGMEVVHQIEVGDQIISVKLQ